MSMRVLKRIPTYAHLVLSDPCQGKGGAGTKSEAVGLAKSESPIGMPLSQLVNWK